MRLLRHAQSHIVIVDAHPEDYRDLASLAGVYQWHVHFLTTAGALWNTSQQPLGILVERYGVPGAGMPATTEVDISYDLPSDVALPQKKKAKKKVTEATPSTTTSDSQEGGGRLGNAKNGAASGAMGDPNGIAVSARTRYLYELKLFFDQRKRYPAQARELGHTGEVLVGFEVLADGKIQNVTIATASRHERLNQAALALVTTAGNFKPPPPELGGSPWKLTVPIRYELN